MTILDLTPDPRHRNIYPGELGIGIGSQRLGGDETYPAGVAIRLQHADCHSGTSAVARRGLCTLVAKNGTPVMIIAGQVAFLGTRLAEAADLAVFTGDALAGELMSHIRALLAGFRPEDTYLYRILRFRDPAGYNDLLCELAARHLGVSRTATLQDLRDDVEKNARLQAAWYASHGPSAPGETQAGYQAEAAAFQTLTSAWLQAADAALATA